MSMQRLVFWGIVILLVYLAYKFFLKGKMG